MKNAKVLLFIDDEPSIRQVVRACLENYSNWHAAIAPSAKAGLAIAAATKPDAILLDVLMPDMDGLAFLKQLQTDPELASIPVVLLTSHIDLTESQNFSKLGIKGAIVKPFDPISLVPQIASILGWQV